eukprot:9215688-Alexandrium_andersonii.AAC.1
MSASLVGSEMCIRDRLGARRRTYRPKRYWPPRRPGGALRRATGMSQSAGCLLYTSDAADDM